MANQQDNESKIETLAEALLEHIGNIDDKINDAIMNIADGVEEKIREIVRDELEKANG